MGTFGLVHQGMENVVIRRSWSMFIMEPIDGMMEFCCSICSK
jgi:hypothetical protein